MAGCRPTRPGSRRNWSRARPRGRPRPRRPGRSGRPESDTALRVGRRRAPAPPWSPSERSRVRSPRPLQRRSSPPPAGTVAWTSPSVRVRSRSVRRPVPTIVVPRAYRPCIVISPSLQAGTSPARRTRTHPIATLGAARPSVLGPRSRRSICTFVSLHWKIIYPAYSGKRVGRGRSGRVASPSDSPRGRPAHVKDTR